MANIKIEIQTEEAREFLAIAQMLNTLGGSTGTAVTAPEPENIFAKKNRENAEKKVESEKVTVTDTTDDKTSNSDEAPAGETADEKRKRERRERDAKRKAEKDAEKNDAKADDSKSDESSDDGEKSIEDYKALIRPLLTSKAKEVEGGREKIRAKFDSLGASGLGALADENVKEFYEFISAL